MTKRISISLPDKITGYLKYLEKNGYGSKSEIVKSTGVIPLIIEIYSRVKEDEERKKNGE